MSPITTADLVDRRGLIPMGRKRPLGQYLKETWRRRDFAIAMPLGDLRAQNMDTVLGNLWHVMNPVLLVGVYFLIFGVLLDVSRGVENFLPFLTIGVFSFHYSQKTVIAGAKSVSSNKGLLRSFQFPRVLLPTATVIGQTLAFLPAIGIMLLVALANGEQLRAAWLILLPIFALQGVFNLGAAFIVARLADRFRDLQNVLPFIFRLLFYLSGVLYLVESVLAHHPTLLAAFNLNPFYVFVTLARGPVMAEMSPDPLLWVSALIWAVVVLVVGFWYFRAGEHEYGRG